MDGLNHLIDRIEELVKLGNTTIDEQIRALERLTRILGNGGCNPPDRIMKLQFRNEISESILTGEKFSVEVALVDSMTNNIVQTGQESSAKVEIVVLNGEVEDDLTGEAFKDKIVPEMEGKEPLLRENPQVLKRGRASLDKIRLKLQRGRASLDKISFKHIKNDTKQRKFRLGARITNKIFAAGVRVIEAMTETFTVKDFRYKYNRKHKNPLLSDEASRLVNIGRRGKIVENLKANKIETVEDFLIQLLRDPEWLKRIAKLGGRKWEKTVDNARQACLSDGRMYCYINSERKMGVAFNVLGQVLGLYLNDQYSPTTTLSENHKAGARELLSSAYKHWDGVKTFDDENALKSYLNGIRIPDFKNAEYRGETVGESSSKSHISVERTSSAMNSNTEIGGDDPLNLFSIDDTEIVNDDSLQLSPLSMFGWETMISGFDDFPENADEQGSPCLDDEVWRQENISKNGSLHQQLREKNINTVEDPENLHNILLMTETSKRSETTLKHARTCTLSDTLREIQPENRIISPPNHLENFWKNLLHLPHDYNGDIRELFK